MCATLPPASQIMLPRSGLEASFAALTANRAPCRTQPAASAPSQLHGKLERFCLAAHVLGAQVPSGMVTGVGSGLGYNPKP